MKLPFTEKFLWDIYNLIEGVSDVYTAFSLPSLKNILYPEMAQIYKIIKKKKSRREFSKFIDYLKRKGYIKLEKRKATKVVFFTKKGWRKILKISLEKEKLKRRKDGRGVMVIFDIPEKMRRKRDIFREYLKKFGFKMFQQSVWISLYDVLDNIENLAKGLIIDRYLKIMLVEEIEIA